MSPTPLLRSAGQRLLQISLHQGKPVSAQLYNIGVDVSSSLVSSEIDERQSTGMLASPLLTEKREVSAVPARIYHSAGESSMSSSSHIRSAGRLVAVYSQKWKSSRDPGSVQEHFPQVKEYGLNISELRDHLKYDQMKQPQENRQPYEESLMRNLLRDYFLRSKGIRYHVKQDLG